MARAERNMVGRGPEATKHALNTPRQSKATYKSRNPLKVKNENEVSFRLHKERVIESSSRERLEVEPYH